MEFLSSQKSKYFVFEGGMCAICGNEIEDKDYVFTSCEVAVSTRQTVFRWLHLSPIIMGTINDTMQWVDSCRMPEKKKKVIEAVCLTTIWILWKFRNAFIFKNQELRKEYIVDSIKEFAFLWICNRRKKSVYSWIDWLKNPADGM